jgi:hypothetical protein
VSDTYGRDPEVEESVKENYRQLFEANNPAAMWVTDFLASDRRVPALQAMIDQWVDGLAATIPCYPELERFVKLRNVGTPEGQAIELTDALRMVFLHAYMVGEVMGKQGNTSVEVAGADWCIDTNCELHAEHRERKLNHDIWKLLEGE